MFKRKMAAFAAALLLLPVCGASASQVQDSADGREVLSMADVDTELLTPASAKEPMTEQAEPEPKKDDAAPPLCETKTGQLTFF